MNSNYYTLRGYKLKNKKIITESMEDYIEMIYRNELNEKKIQVKDLAYLLNVKQYTKNKKISKIKKIKKKKIDNKNINLTNNGKNIGKYLLYRHNILTTFFKRINKDQYKLDQVEKIEHFIDYISIKNIEKLIKKNL